MLCERKRKKSRAQSLVEFTLVAPLLLLIIAVTVDFARVVYTYSAISAAARASISIPSCNPSESWASPGYCSASGFLRDGSIA